MVLDSGIAKMGIFAFVLLVAFAGLISIIPAEYLGVTDYGNPADKIPERWNGIEIGRFNFTESWNTTILNSEMSETFDVGGRNLRFFVQTVLLQINNFRLAHRYGFLLLGEEHMDWFTEEEYGSTIYYQGNLDEASEDYGVTYNSTRTIQFEVICQGLPYGSSYFKVTSILGFNATAYNTPSEAWYNNDLDILVGINAENTNWQKDIWYLISNLLTFNTLYVFGTTDLFAVILNGILAAIIYVPIIIFATAIILEVLPF